MGIYYLYVKRHNKTGLKYLGYTGSKDPHKYKGSGLHWKRHIKTHGYNVTTEIIYESESLEDIKEKGLYYNKLWDIVKSRSWANMCEESGKGGFSYINNNGLRYINKNPLFKKDDQYTKDIGVLGGNAAFKQQKGIHDPTKNVRVGWTSIEHHNKAITNAQSPEAKTKRMATRAIKQPYKDLKHMYHENHGAKRIPKNKIDSYLKDGWVLGRKPKTTQK